MKIRGYKFGHPVFGYYDYYDFAPDFEIHFEVEENQLCISQKSFDLGSNLDLRNLINNQEAIIIAEVFCSHTMYRKCFRLEEEFKITISIDDLKNKVECFFFIVSNQVIEDFRNSSLKENLKDDSYYVEEGDILAFLGEYKFDLDLKGTTVDSFIKIRKKTEKDKGVSYIFLDDSIILEIFEDDYNKMMKFHLNPDYQHILISGLLQPALIHACYKLKEEEYEDKQWYRVLMLRWGKFSGTEDSPTADQIPEFVEHLLQDPMNRLLEILESFDEYNAEDDSI